MKTVSTYALSKNALGLACIAAAVVGLAGCNGDDEGPAPLTVPKATCGPNDRPETALQGQVPAAMRASGFQGFSCNLQLIGQSKGDGASWQHAWFRDSAGRTCAYYDTAASTADRKNLGTVVVDVSQPSTPTPTAYLTSVSMMDPWESLKANAKRQLLAAVNGTNAFGGPQVDVYDISGDCRSPQLLSSVSVGVPGTGGPVVDLVGHEGEFSPDGLTFYGSDLQNALYYPIDITDPTKPKLIATFQNPFFTPGRTTGNATAHGLSVSDDGNRAYFTSIVRGAWVDFANIANPTVGTNNGLIVVDVSDIQSRKANPQMRVVSTLFWKDGQQAQHTIPIAINGKSYLVAVDEGGAGGGGATGANAACAVGLPAFPFARLIDLSDEKNPRIVSKMMLEIHDPANCSKVLPDVAGQSSFMYGSHYCSVDNRKNATTLACGYFNSGIRVFDIRDPERPKEIAYYNPAGTTTRSPGSNHGTNWVAGGPDWCNAQVRLDAATASLQTTCQDNGFLSLKFTNGAWPFPETTTPPGQQN